MDKAYLNDQPLTRNGSVSLEGNNWARKAAM